MTSGPSHPGDSVVPDGSTELADPSVSIFAPELQRAARITAGQTFGNRYFEGGHRWMDLALDADEGWIDIRRVSFGMAGTPRWNIQLASDAPPFRDRDPAQRSAYGLVLDTDGDLTADYVIGIDDNAAKGFGVFRVWITDLATDETEEQVGGPYGYPIEFSHPDEQEGGHHMHFNFLSASEAPANLDPDRTRFFAWAATTTDGVNFDWDYAPNAGWWARS